MDTNPQASAVLSRTWTQIPKLYSLHFLHVPDVMNWHKYIRRFHSPYLLQSSREGRTLPPGKTRYPLYRRMGGPQGRSGRAENLVPTGIRSRTVQPVAQSLYRLSYSAPRLNQYKNKLIIYVSFVAIRCADVTFWIAQYSLFWNICNSLTCITVTWTCYNKYLTTSCPLTESSGSEGTSTWETPRWIRRYNTPSYFIGRHGFTGPKSKCWDGSQDSKLPLDASHVSLPT